MDAKQARKLPHLNFSPQEWFFSTRFHSLPARGLLIDLASIQWMRGGFPDDRAAIERLVGAAVTAEVWSEITPLFVPVGVGVGLRWVEEERTAAITRIEKAAKGGANGGKATQAKARSSQPQGTLEAPLRHPKAILDCIGLERTESERTESNRPLAPTRTAKPVRSKPKDPLAWTPDGGWQGVTEPDRAAWATAYPACNIDRQLAAADQWLRANPKRATKSAWRRFVVGWLSRSQERGGDAKTNGQHKPIDRQAAQRAASREAWGLPPEDDQ